MWTPKVALDMCLHQTFKYLIYATMSSFIVRSDQDKDEAENKHQILNRILNPQTVTKPGVTHLTSSRKLKVKPDTQAPRRLRSDIQSQEGHTR